MPPKSPSQAFDPTPAIPDPANDNIVTISENRSSMRTNDFTNGAANRSKEVRFSPMTSPPRRAQSLATSVPLLEPISSASQVPRLSVKTKYSTPAVDFNAYVEQSRSFLDTLRQNFERERTTLQENFSEERRLWDLERQMLLSKIADLESSLRKNGGRTYSSEPSTAVQSAASFRADNEYQNPYAMPPGGRSFRQGSDESHHVWEGPENNTVTRVFSNESKRGSEEGHAIWEGPENNTVTRVFSNESRKKDEHMPSIAEDEPPSTESALSPKTNAGDRNVTVSIPIEKLDSQLDGISLKASALPPDIVAKVITPTSGSPTRRSPSPNPTVAVDPKAEKQLHVSLDGLLTPLDEKLKRHAGHTPLARPVDSNDSSMKESPEIPTPKQEKPPAPVPSVRPPNERADSYFPPPEEHHDPELKGPLSLENEEAKDSRFLEELDKKLLNEARKVVYNPREPAADTRDDQDDKSSVGDEGPQLKLKRSTNFGSAFGSNKCGNL